jgi:AcrR family transcriptional regulator
MGTKERRDRERLETREKILAAARDMFATEGFEAVTMRAIADRIEYTPTAIYHHFANKQALLTELCEHDFQSLANHFTSSAAPRDPIQRLYAIGEAYLKFATAYPSQYRFMFMTVLPPLDPASMEHDRNDPERDAYAFLRQACAEAIAKRCFRPAYDDPDQVAQILWSGVHGLISLRIAKGQQEFVPWKDLKSTARLMMQALIEGMRRSSTRK